MYKKRKRPISKENNGNKVTLAPVDENSSIKINRKNISDVVIEEPAPLTEENIIPCSQEQTQRYLSQRSTTAATFMHTQTRNTSSQRTAGCYFELVLMRAGVTFDQGDSFILSSDHVAFVNKLREVLVRSHNYPENVETFKAGLSTALALQSTTALKLLTGCTVSPASMDNVYQSQDSMLVNFLMIDFLCDHVVDVLLQQIKQEAGERASMHTSGTLPLMPLLLAQLRYVRTSHSERIYACIEDIFQDVDEWASWEIIANAEFILDASKHDAFAQMLLDKLVSSESFFHTTTIQSLTSLSLTTPMQRKLRCKILAYIEEDQCPATLLPVLVKFLLKIVNEENDTGVDLLVNSLREILIHQVGIVATTKDPNERQIQLDIHCCIEQSLKRSRKLYQQWQKATGALAAHRFQPIDFIMLLMLVHIREDNTLYIGNMLRSRIKNETITLKVLTEAKTRYCVMLEQHAGTLMQILHDFLREKHPSVAGFARDAYTVLFQICETVQRAILNKLLELTCDKSTGIMTMLALQMLHSLQRQYPRDIQNWGSLLLPLLDRLHEMTLSQTRLVMEILCAVAYPVPGLNECTVVQDQVDMLVKKQLINRASYVQKQGIIGSVQLIDSIARIESRCAANQLDECNDTFDSISDLPEGRGKIAANYILRLQSSTLYCAESLALFYDELACICAAQSQAGDAYRYYDKAFLTWLCESMTFSFQSSFVCDSPPATVSGLELSYQKCINSGADTSTGDLESEVLSVGVNIAGLVLQPAGAEASSSIAVLAPLFKLVRYLHVLRNAGSLETINALLGCAIVLPSCFENANLTAFFQEQDEPMQRKILDIHFHCVNWMRETVSSFATQCDAMIRRKVLLRLTELIAVEKRVRALLLLAPTDYMPPMCQFINGGRAKQPAQPGKAARGRPQAPVESEPVEGYNATLTSRADESIATHTAAHGRGHRGAARVKPDFETLYGPKEIYRQLDSDIVLILREKLSLHLPLSTKDYGIKIGLVELRFILVDLVCKLESVTGAISLDTEETLQYIAKPHYFINDLSKFLTVIFENMQMITGAMDAKLKCAKGAYGHADLFTNESNYLKVCFGLCVRLFAVFFAAPQLNDETKADFVRESLLALLERSVAIEMSDKSCSSIATAAFNDWLRFEPLILDLGTAVHFYRLMLTLKRHSAAKWSNTLSGNVADTQAEVSKSQAKKIRSLCQKFLCRKWYAYDNTAAKGATCNYHLNELVQGFLKDSGFERQLEILRIVQEETGRLTGKDAAMQYFPNIRKANFPLLFRGLCEAVNSCLSSALSTQRQSSEGEQLSIWEDSCAQFNALLDIIHLLDMPRNFQLFLKYSHIYIKLVLQHGLPVLEQCLRRDPERISEFLKGLQVTTRFLHNLCVHSKASKKIAIVSQIPFLRETVEQLLFRVKALLAANKCANVFWMGSLKNKDLHGDEVMSQIGTLSRAENSSDEDIPDDDAIVDETIIEESTSLEQADSDSVGVKTNSHNGSKSSSRSKCF